MVQYDYTKVKSAFENDEERMEYYYPQGLMPIPANRISKTSFLEKKEVGTIAAQNYIELKPELCYSCAKQEESVFEQTYVFNFYEGIAVLIDFDKLIQFLSIWQFLREKALVLDVAQPIDIKTVGLFFELTDQAVPEPKAEKGRDVLEFSDRKYLSEYHRPEQIYRLSEVHLQMCREFLGRRIYATPKLGLFLRNGFRTWDEIQHQHALIAAWAAVIVAIIIALVDCFSSTRVLSCTCMPCPYQLSDCFATILRNIIH